MTRWTSFICTAALLAALPMTAGAATHDEDKDKEKEKSSAGQSSQMTTDAERQDRPSLTQQGQEQQMRIGTIRMQEIMQALRAHQGQQGQMQTERDLGQDQPGAIDLQQQRQPGAIQQPGQQQDQQPASPFSTQQDQQSQQPGQQQPGQTDLERQRSPLGQTQGMQQERARWSDYDVVRPTTPPAAQDIMQFNTMMDKIQKILPDVAKEHNVDAVVPMALYKDQNVETVDLTQEVIKKLRQQQEQAGQSGISTERDVSPLGQETQQQEREIEIEAGEAEEQTELNLGQEAEEQKEEVEVELQ